MNKVILLVVIVASFASLSAVRAETFLVRNLDRYSPYSSAILEIDISHNAGTGVLSPVRGDATPIAKAYFKLISPNKLQISSIGWIVKRPITFTRFVKDNQEIWASKIRRGFEGRNYPEGLYFYRPLNSRFTEEALTLTQETCGSYYGRLAVRLNDNIAQSALKELVVRPHLKSLPMSIGVGGDEYWKESTFGEGLLDIHSGAIKIEDGTVFNQHHIHVPIGAEALIIRELRESKLFSYVSLADEPCGAFERKQLVVDRTLCCYSNENFNAVKFKRFFSNALTQIYSEGDLQSTSYKIDQIVTKPNRINPKFSLFRAKIQVKSEISRQVSGQWDQFYVILEPFLGLESSESEISLVVTVEKAKNAPQNRGRVSPPASRWYDEEMRFGDEELITLRLMGSLKEAFEIRCFHSTMLEDYSIAGVSDNDQVAAITRLDANNLCSG